MIALLLFIIGIWLVIGSLTAAAAEGDFAHKFGYVVEVDLLSFWFAMFGPIAFIVYIMECKQVKRKPFTNFRFR